MEPVEPETTETHATGQRPVGPEPDEKPRMPFKALLLAVGIVAVFAAGLLVGTLLPTDDDDSGPDQTAEPAPPTAEPAPPTASGTAAPTAEPAPPTAGAGPGTPPAAMPAYNPFRVVDFGSGPCAPAEGAAEPVYEFDDAPALCINPNAAYTAVFDTDKGEIEVALDAANTPGTVNNFVNLARYRYYDNTLIHRSDPSIGILQGGSPHTNNASDPGPGYTIWDEGSGFTYQPGLIAMARTNNPNSADAQFFFTVTNASSLLDAQGDSVVFGQVTRGLDVLTAILDTHQDQPGNNFGGTPWPPTAINSITVQTQ